MAGFLSAMALVSFDFFAEAGLPCFFDDIDYYFLLVLASIVPITLVGVMAVGGILWAAVCKQHTSIPNDSSGHRSTGVVVRGLWFAAPVVLFFLDLVFPVVTRVTLQFFVCRDLSVAGWYLESDYGTSKVAVCALLTQVSRFSFVLPAFVLQGFNAMTMSGGNSRHWP